MLIKYWNEKSQKSVERLHRIFILRSRWNKYSVTDGLKAKDNGVTDIGDT